MKGSFNMLVNWKNTLFFLGGIMVVGFTLDAYSRLVWSGLHHTTFEDIALITMFMFGVILQLKVLYDEDKERKQGK